MAITRQKKDESIAELKDLVSRSKAVILSDYRGLTATQMASIRNKLRSFDTRFLVAKNTLMVKALQDLGMSMPEEVLQGPSVIGFCFGDFRAPVQAILEAAKETDVLKIKGGLLGTHTLSASEIASLPTLPKPEVLQAQVLGALQGPLAGVIGALDGALRGVLYVLEARKDQMEQSSAA